MSALLLVYPVLIFVSVRWHIPWLGMLALLGFGAHVLWPALQSGKRWSWLMMLILAATGACAVAMGDGRALIQLMPAMVFLMLALFFGRTLVGASLPLVTRIASAARGVTLDQCREQMPAELLRYTRRVTWLWTLVFICLALENLCMLWFAPPMPWPYVVNAMSFSIVTALMLGEYLYHSRRYPNPKHNNFLDFVRDVAAFDYHSLLDD